MNSDAEPCDADRVRVESRQMPIFARDASAVCMELELPWHEAVRLFEDGLLSFNPGSAGALDESREAELVFLGALVTAGCSRAMLRQLLVGLRRPYCYDVRRMFYAWTTQQWQLLPGEADAEGAFFAFLERLRERHARDTLLNLRSWLDEALDLAHERTQMFAHLAPNLARRK